MRYQRILEAITIQLHCFICFHSGILFSFFTICASIYYPIGWFFAIGYAIWIYYEYHEVICKGGKRTNWVRNCSYFQHLMNNFNFKVVATTKLDPNINYIFAGHPHGVWSMCSLYGTNNNTGGVDTVYPNHKISLITTRWNTCFPFHREYYVHGGVIVATEESMIYALTKCGPGRIVLVMAGGAREGFLAGSRQILAMKHKGFCRVALKCGTPIVPFFAFGEGDVNRKKILTGFRKKITDFVLNTIFKYVGLAGVPTKGFTWVLPFIVAPPDRVPITFVSGAPIPVEKVENPTKKEIDDLHGKYIEKLLKLYDAEKHKYAKDPTVELELL